MARTTKTITLSLPPELMEEINQLMKEEGRTRSELLREALRRYAEEQKWKKIYRYAELKAKERGITEDQIEDLIDALRS
jgi:CopG family transcriptional regulator/antitoxin EndoAI